MFILKTVNGETRRLEIPTAIERAGTADAYAAKPPADAWHAAEKVSASWPFDDDAVVPSVPPITDASDDAPAEE